MRQCGIAHARAHDHTHPNGKREEVVVAARGCGRRSSAASACTIDERERLALCSRSRRSLRRRRRLLVTDLLLRAVHVNLCRHLREGEGHKVSARKKSAAGLGEEVAHGETNSSVYYRAQFQWRPLLPTR